jgi:hypothetical protein
MAQQMLTAVQDFTISIVIKSTTHMSEINQPTTALGLTGLTVNARTLIAPWAFLCLTHGEQCQFYGQPMAGIAMTPAPSFGRCLSNQGKKPKGTKQEPIKI